jgi:hypothetical protein
MERQPGIRRVTPILVHSTDKFAIINGEPEHEYNPFDDARVFEHPLLAEKNKRTCALVGGYLKVEYTDTNRESDYHFVSARKIHRNRECAETQTIWSQWFEEMVYKTILRDGWSKRIVSIDPQLAERIGRVDAADNLALGNDPSRGQPAQLPPPSGSRTQQLAARVGARELPGTATVVGDDALPNMANAIPQGRETENPDGDDVPFGAEDVEKATAEGRVIVDEQGTRVFGTKELADAAREADAHAKHIDAQIAGKTPAAKTAPAAKNPGLNLSTK